MPLTGHSRPPLQAVPCPALVSPVTPFPGPLLSPTGACSLKDRSSDLYSTHRFILSIPKILLEKGTATHFSIHAWRIPGSEPDELHSPWGRKESDMSDFYSLTQTPSSSAAAAVAAAKSLQSCPTLCDPMDCSPPGSSVHGIFLARVLEWVAIAFSTF